VSGFSITDTNTALTSFLELNAGRAAIIHTFQGQPGNGAPLAVTLLLGNKINHRGISHEIKEAGEPKPCP